ncbi:MAG TPA: hypothetical protein VMF12_19725 [Xanthobacteraceae bacterium]|nr:hypothetical protein [Xanthobacteraceae bacterium]
MELAGIRMLLLWAVSGPLMIYYAVTLRLDSQLRAPQTPQLTITARSVAIPLMLGNTRLLDGKNAQYFDQGNIVKEYA